MLDDKTLSKLLDNQDDKNIRTLLDKVFEELGGPDRVAKHMARLIDDKNVTPATKQKALQLILTLTQSVSEDKDDFSDVSTEELRDAVMRAVNKDESLRHLSNQPDTDNREGSEVEGVST